jgi:S-adenosylmethionine:tRNA ribosyltransferase-isomerase
MLPIADFDFVLPEHLIAQEPRPRGESRLMVVDRQAGTWREQSIRDLPSLLSPGDLLVVNDTRVFPARLLGRRDPSGGHVECLLLERLDAGSEDPALRRSIWSALVHPGQKLKPGTRVLFEDPDRAPGVRLHATVLARRFFGRREIALERDGEGSIDDAIDRLGHVPLPPYIRRPDTPEDRERYQTVFARTRGSVAAPTAGLHFDEALLDALGDAGVGRTAITLHVGYGTFKPVRTEDASQHRVDPEWYDVPPEAARAITGTRAAGKRVVAVGTTTARALESAVDERGDVRAGAGRTDLFIYPGRPGFRFRGTDALVTNFHLPRSSLLLLVCAFGGRELVLAAYRDAVAREFRFYSYGDAMLLL